MKNILNKIISVLQNLTTNCKLLETNINSIMLSEQEYNQINNELDNLSSNYLNNTVSITIYNLLPEYGNRNEYDITINEIYYKISPLNHHSFISGRYDEQLGLYEFGTSVEDFYNNHLLSTTTIYALYPLYIYAKCSLPEETDRLTLRDKEGNIIYRDFGGTYLFTITNGPKLLYIEHICDD